MDRVRQRQPAGALLLAGLMFPSILLLPRAALQQVEQDPGPSPSPGPTTNTAPPPAPSGTATATRLAEPTTIPATPDSPTTTPAQTALPTSASPTLEPSPSPTSIPAGAVRISEVAWAGTRASANDEWIELHNTTDVTVSLEGWSLTDRGDIAVELQGTLAPHSYYLMERTDDSTVASRAADLLYAGSLRNSGEILSLLDSEGNKIDSANGDGGSWPAGNTEGRRSMERHGAADAPSSWFTFAGVPTALDAGGNPIAGSPGEPNPTPGPLPTPSAGASVEPTRTLTHIPVPPERVVINEIAWAGTFASANDEWIELHNPWQKSVSLEGWILTDRDDIAITLHGAIPPSGYFLLERTDDSTVTSAPADLVYTGSLRNSGEVLELLDPSGSSVSAANQDGGSWPAGSSEEKRSMERFGGGDSWVSFSGAPTELDADGQSVLGTPRLPNSPLSNPPTATPTATVTGTLVPPGKLLINEVAWAGTRASPSDEWIELYNPGVAALALDGWRLTDGGDINLPLEGHISGGGFLLLERTDDRTVSDIPAAMIYSGTLRNGGERLRLLSPGGQVIDEARAGRRGWPAGDADDRASMERLAGTPLRSRWATFTGWRGIGRDADGKPIRGTPGGANSVLFPTPTPTEVPGEIVINEVLIRPHYDWEGTGGVTPADEFIELYNHGPDEVYLRGWFLDDIPEGGSRPFDLPGVTISPGGRAVFFRSMTNLALNDGGDHVRLLAPNGRLVDEIAYLRVSSIQPLLWPSSRRQRRPDLWPVADARGAECAL